MEKRLERLERTGTPNETIKELTEIVRSNQHVIDNVVKLNADMLSKVSEMVTSVNNMTSKMNDFISRIEVASGGGSQQEGGGAAQSDELERRVDERLSKLEKRVNAMILSTMKIKR
jgi:uncharacterized coiled-coil protein SlyX